MAATILEAGTGGGLPLSCSSRYSLLRVLGTGNFGTVFLAVDPELDRQVAIKVLKIEGDLDDSRWARLVREAKIGVKLRHPGIVTLLDCQLEEDPPWLVYEYVEGGPLSESFGEHGLPWIDVLESLMQIIPALGEAHAQGIIHRDLKPENILLTSDGTLKLIDFGLARLIDQSQTLTQSGRIAGTPWYLAPEVIAGQPASALADQYSLGIVAFEMVTGKRPFEGPTVMSLLDHHMKTPPPDPCTLQPALPKSFGQIIRRMMSKDPGSRFPELQEILQSLQEIRERRSLDPKATTEIRAVARVDTGELARTRSITVPHAAAAGNPRPTAGRIVAVTGIVTLALLGAGAFAVTSLTAPSRPETPPSPSAAPASPVLTSMPSAERFTFDREVNRLFDRTRERTRSRLRISIEFLSAESLDPLFNSFRASWTDLERVVELEEELGEGGATPEVSRGDRRRRASLVSVRFLLETEIMQQAIAYETLDPRGEVFTGKRAPVGEKAALKRLEQCLQAYKSCLDLGWTDQELDEVMELVLAVRRVAARNLDIDWVPTRRAERDTISTVFENYLGQSDPEVERPPPWRRLAQCAWRHGNGRLDPAEMRKLREEATGRLRAHFSDQHVDPGIQDAMIRKFHAALE